MNKLIANYSPEEFQGKWKVSVEDGSVCIGSAVEKWAISKRIMEKYKCTFKDIFELTEAKDYEKLQAGRADRRGDPDHDDRAPAYSSGGAGLQDSPPLARRPRKPGREVDDDGRRQGRRERGDIQHNIRPPRRGDRNCEGLLRSDEEGDRSLHVGKERPAEDTAGRHIHGSRTGSR